MNQIKRYFEIRVNRYLLRREMKLSNRKVVKTNRITRLMCDIEAQILNDNPTRQQLMQMAKKARLLLYISPFSREKSRATLLAAERRLKYLERINTAKAEQFKGKLAQKNNALSRKAALA